MSETKSGGKTVGGSENFAMFAKFSLCNSNFFFEK